MLTDKEHEVRRHTVGSSDVPAILGLSSFKSHVGILADKLLAKKEQKGVWLRLGQKLEKPIAEFALQEGLIPGLMLFPGWTVVDDWRSATPDFYAMKSGNMTYRRARPFKEEDSLVVEVKNVGVGMMKDWKNGPPDYVEAQVQWQLLVLKHQRALVVALIGGRDVKAFPVERDDAWLKITEKTCREFWEKNLHPDRRDKPHARVKLARLQVQMQRAQIAAAARRAA